MLNYTLGTIEASEALIKDLYIDLRAKADERPDVQTFIRGLSRILL